MRVCTEKQCEPMLLEGSIRFKYWDMQYSISNGTYVCIIYTAKEMDVC